MALANPLAIGDFYDLFKVQDVQFVQGWQQQRSATGGGETRYADRAPSLWKAEITTIPMLNAEAEGIMALINSRAGGTKTVLMYNSRLRFPASDPNGEWLSTGSNVPVGGRSVAYDFANDDFEIEGRPAVSSQVISCVRASSGLALDSVGTWHEFANNVPRITDRGLLIEPAATNTNQRSNDLSNGQWTLDAVTTADAGNGWTSVRETVTAQHHRALKGTGTTVALGQPYTETWWVRKVGRRYLGVRTNAIGGNLQVGFDLDTLSVTYAASGLSGAIEKIGPVYRLSVSYVTAGTGVSSGLLTATSAITSDTLPSFAGNTNMGFDFFNLDRIAGNAGAWSPIITAGATATRAADTIAPRLPPGAHDLIADFDNGGTQALAGKTDGYTLPTNLNRSVVASIAGIKVSTTPASPAAPKLGTITDRLHVAFTGFPPGYVIPRGTYFSIVFDTSRYYLGQFAEARTANSITGTVAATEIWPPLPASISGTPDIVMIKPPARFRIEPGSAYPAKEGGLHSTIKFSAEQTYSH